MKKIKELIAVFALVIGFGVVLAPVSVGAVDVYDACGSNSDSAVCGSTNDNVQNIVGTVVDVMIYLIGIVSVIVIIIAGFTYTTSNGEPGQIKKAKDTLTYAIAGLIIALLAFAVVNFVIGKI